MVMIYILYGYGYDLYMAMVVSSEISMSVGFFQDQHCKVIQ